MAKHVGLNDVSKAALIRAARNAVAGALAGDFPVDPIVGPDLSRAISIVGSVVKRHGSLIEMGIAGALIASDRFIVLTNVALPLTKGAIQLLDAKNADEDLGRIRLSADSEAEGIVNVDLVVVDPDARWAGAYEVKRGNGVTEHGKRRPIVRKLKAARLVLASYVKQAGYGSVDEVTSAVIDYFGGSGFDSDLALTREQLDLHFGVPVAATVDSMTETTRDTLHAALPGLLAPVIEGVLPGKTEAGKKVETVATAGPTPTGDAVVQALYAPPTGPRQHGSRSSEPTAARRRAS